MVSISPGHAREATTENRQQTKNKNKDKTVSFATSTSTSTSEDLPSLSSKAKRRLDRANAAEPSSHSNSRSGRKKRRRENDAFADHPFLARLSANEGLLDRRDLMPPTHNALRPGPFAAVLRNPNLALPSYDTAMTRQRQPQSTRQQPSHNTTTNLAPQLAKADRRLRKTIASLPSMWPWLHDREEEIIKFSLDCVHGTWQEVFERSRDLTARHRQQQESEEQTEQDEEDVWTTVRHPHQDGHLESDTEGDSNASIIDSETAYVSTANAKTPSRRSSLSVREVPEFLTWTCPDPFARLVLHALCRYYGLNSRTLEDGEGEGGRMVVLVQDTLRGHGPLPLVRFCEVMLGAA